MDEYRELGESSASPEEGTSSTKDVREPSLVGKMATASLHSIIGFAPTALKGMVVDIPLAITEGKRTVPIYHSDKSRDHGRVNWGGGGVGKV